MKLTGMILEFAELTAINPKPGKSSRHDCRVCKVYGAKRSE